MIKLFLYSFFVMTLSSCSSKENRSKVIDEPDYILNQIESNSSVQNEALSPIIEDSVYSVSETRYKKLDSNYEDILNDGTIFPVIVKKSKIAYDQYKNASMELTIVNQSSKIVQSIELTITHKDKSSFHKDNKFVIRKKWDETLPLLTDLNLNPNYQRVISIPVSWDVQMYSEPYITWASFSDGNHWSTSEN